MSEHDGAMNEHDSEVLEHDLPSLSARPDALVAIDGVIADTEALCAKLAAVRRGLARDLRARGIDAKGKLREPIPAGRMPKGWSAPFSSPQPELDERFHKLFSDSTLPVPPLAEQLRVLEILDQHDEAMRAEEALLAKLRTIRTALEKGA